MKFIKCRRLQSKRKDIMVAIDDGFVAYKFVLKSKGETSIDKFGKLFQKAVTIKENKKRSRVD